MSTPRPQPQDIRHRLGRRLQQRYLRWFAKQPAESVFLSQGWRAFWRSCRRRVNALLQSRLILIPGTCLVVCWLLFILSIAVKVVVIVLPQLPDLAFAAPKDAEPALRATLAMTRLTVFQTTMLPLLFFWASRCFCSSTGLETRAFYKSYPSSELVAYRIGFLFFLVCSTAISVGATIGHGAGVYGVAASLTVTGCLGWLAWSAGKRLMAIRWPPCVPQEALAFTICFLFLLLLLPVVINICYGPAVLGISQYLKWLGPCGWVNGLLLGLSCGRTQDLWPLAICCVVSVVSGYRLNAPTASWTFRRQLLSKYRTRASCRRVTTSTAIEQHVARDLRQALSGNGWTSILYPRWVRGREAFLLLLCGSVFLLQLTVAGLVLFLETIENEAGSGQTLNEKLMLCALVSSAAGWNVLVMEGLAVCYRDQSGLLDFAKRPVSPGQVWKQLQLDGVKFAPTQVLLATPFVITTTMVAPAYFTNSCFAVTVALLSCIAIRTTWSAGACYFASIMNLRQWIAFILQGLGTLAGGFLILGTVGSALALSLDPDWTPVATAVNLLTQQIAALVALGIAWGTWFALGQATHRRGTRQPSMTVS